MGSARSCDLASAGTLDALVKAEAKARQKAGQQAGGPLGGRGKKKPSREVPTKVSGADGAGDAG
jgi:hypothetical protein